MHPVLEVRFLARVETRRARPRRQPFAGLHQGAAEKPGPARSSWRTSTPSPTRTRPAAPPFERLLGEVDEAGYHCRWAVLNAADYGVPQLRPRLFVVGVPKARRRCRSYRNRATAAAGSGARLGGRERPHVTSRGSAGWLVTTPEPEEAIRGKWGHLLPDIPPGDNYLFYTAERGHPDPMFKWRSRYWSFLLKLRPCASAPDHPGAAGTERRALPLGQPSASGPRAAAALYLPRRLRAWSVGAARYKHRSATPSHPCWHDG